MQLVKLLQKRGHGVPYPHPLQPTVEASTLHLVVIAISRMHCHSKSMEFKTCMREIDVYLFSVS